MKIQEIKTYDQPYTLYEKIFLNRGITDAESYLKTTDEDICSYNLLGGQCLSMAAKVLINAIYSDHRVCVVVDSDCDGFTSAALLINFLYEWFPAWTKKNLDYALHEGKQHGLQDYCDYFVDTNVYKLVIVPDGGSNDYEQHKHLKDNGIEVIVLDHHEANKISEDAVIVNNQLCDYPNKFLSGVGVVWQFCNYLYYEYLTKIHEDCNEKQHPNYYLDLVALGLVADMMSLKEYETKHLIMKGLKEENIHNPFISYIIQKNKFTLGDVITPHGVAFFIAPFVNAIMRSGTSEEKKITFESFLVYRAFVKIPSTKKGHKVGEEEKLVEQVMRVITNVKRRQTTAQDQGLEYLDNLIKRKNILDHKVMLFLLNSGSIDKNIAGLIANKLVALYQRPCCILTKTELEGEVIYQGSARGYDKSGISGFKTICADFPGVVFAEGHPEAFGLGLKEDMIEEFLEYTDKVFQSMSSEPIFYVDKIYFNKEIDGSEILSAGLLPDIWGKDVEKPLVAVANLIISPDMVTIYAKKTNTIKITLPNNLTIMKFSATDEECELFTKEGFRKINLVGTCKCNEWLGKCSPQIFIETYEVLEDKKYLF